MKNKEILNKLAEGKQSHLKLIHEFAESKLKGVVEFLDKLNTDTNSTYFNFAFQKYLLRVEFLKDQILFKTYKCEWDIGNPQVDKFIHLNKLDIYYNAAYTVSNFDSYFIADDESYKSEDFILRDFGRAYFNRLDYIENK